MVEIIDPREGMKQAEGNVATALHLPPGKHQELRMLGGQYKSMHTNLARYPVDINTTQPETLTGMERRLWFNGYSKGYIAGVTAALSLLAGETSVEMFKAWAEPVEEH